jgi:hypothetical protein
MIPPRHVLLTLVAGESPEVQHEAPPNVDPRAAASAFPTQPGSAQAATQLFDLSALRAPALAPHAIVALEAQPHSAASPRRSACATAVGPAPAPAQTPASRSRRAKSPLPFEIVSSSTLAWSIAGRETRALGTPPAPAQRGSASPQRVASGAVAAGALSLAQTISDNGALRAYAQRLAAEQRKPGRLAPAAALGQRAQALTSAASQRLVALKPHLAWQRARLSARLQRLTPRERLLALPGLCCVPVLAWLLCSTTLSAGSNGASPPAPALHAAAASGPGAPQGMEPGEAPLEAQPREPGTRHSRGAVADDAGLAAPAPAAADTPAEQRPADGRAFAFAKTHGSGDPARQRPSLEQDAYRAAFGGNTSRGVALYEELARERGDETFRHAARLLQADRVHKP